MSKRSGLPALSASVRPLPLVLALSLLAGLALAAISPAQAEIVDLGLQDGTFRGTLAEDEWMAYSQAGLRARESLSIHLIVENGSAVDVYLFTTKTFEEYLDPRILVVPPLWGEEKVREEARTVYDKPVETLVVVVDNSRISNDGAMPDGEVAFTLKLDRVIYTPPWLTYLLVSAALLGTALLGVRRFWRRRPRRAFAATRLPATSANRHRRQWWQRLETSTDHSRPTHTNRVRVVRRTRSR